MSITRIQNNQITDSTIIGYAKVNAGSLTGNLFAPSITLNSNVTITGNLTLTGNADTINATNTYINDPLVVFNSGYVGSLTGYDIGVLVNRNLSSLAPYGSVNTAWIWSEAAGAFVAIATTDTGSGTTSINNSGYANVVVGNTSMVSGTVGGAFAVSGATTLNTATGASFQGVIGNVTPSSGFFSTATATTVNAATIGNIGANVNGTGTYLTALNASNLTSGTVPSAQISGAYTGITQVGTLTANTVVNNTLYAQGVYDNGVRVVSTSSGAGNLSISGTAINLPQTGPGAVNAGSATTIPTIVTDAYGRIVSLTSNSVSTTVNLTGTSGSGSFAGGGTLTFASTNGVTIAVGTSYANISTPQDLRISATPTFNGLYSNVGSTSLSINGNALVSNTGIINLGSISNVQVSGGASGYAVTTNGTGTLSFSAANVIVLGSNSSGQLVSNAVSLTSTTDVTDAISQLNAILGKLTPASPPNFPATTLTQSTGTISGLMTNFAQTDNSGWGNLSVAGGTAVNATRSAVFATSTVTNSGTTTTGGNIQLYLNGSILPSNYHALTSSPSSADNGTYGNLVVSSVQDYHNVVSTVAAGFWYVFSASVAATSIPAGWNRVNIFYTGDAASTPTLTWYYDSSSPTAPAFSGTSMALTSNTVTYSSTIPHLNSSAGFTLNGTVQNLSGDMYYAAWTSTSANFFSSLGSGGALLAPANRTLAQVGVPLPLTRSNTTAYTFSTTSNVTTGFGSATATTGPTLSVSTPYATTGSGQFAPGNIILYKTGTSTQIEETSLTSSYGTAARIVNPDGGTAADNPAYTGTESTFNSASGTLLATDATVVAAVLKYDVTNYSTGYYPVGPNLSSGRAASQYFTFKFNYAALSSFYIHYTGTLAGLWIACPGVTDTPASPTNGWLNAAVAYAGSGVPGTGTGGNGSNGCAVGGTATLNSNGTYNINVTFGSVNTSSAGNKSNEVYVRVKLTSGQSLTVLNAQSS
jgi:hypothetical protein